MFGAIATLHTFGRSLQWNHHIHVLLSEEGFDRLSKKLKSFAFMSYQKLRKTWMYEVLKLMEPKLGKDFYDLKQQLYRNQMIESFQVYPILCSCGALMTYAESYVPEKGVRLSDRSSRERCLYDMRRLKQRKRYIYTNEMCKI